MASYDSDNESVRESSVSRGKAALDQHTLFADVYSSLQSDSQAGALHGSTYQGSTLRSSTYRGSTLRGTLHELEEEEYGEDENGAGNAEWMQRYREIQKKMETRNADQYGYGSSKRKIVFVEKPVLTHEEKVRQAAGDAPAAFSTHSQTRKTARIVEEDDDDDEIDL